MHRSAVAQQRYAQKCYGSVCFVYSVNLSQIVKSYFKFAWGNIYLNAKDSQLLLKCYFLLFEPKILLHDIMINKSNDVPSKQHENQTSETYDCRSSTRNVSQPKFGKSQLQYLTFYRVTELHHLTFYRVTELQYLTFYRVTELHHLTFYRVTELQYLTFYRVTELHHLTFYSEKVFNLYLFSKSEGQTNPSRLFYAFGNLHYVHVKPSIFDVIGRLSTAKYQ